LRPRLRERRGALLSPSSLLLSASLPLLLLLRGRLLVPSFCRLLLPCCVEVLPVAARRQQHQATPITSSHWQLPADNQAAMSM
jgi:hypothetical protein